MFSFSAKKAVKKTEDPDSEYQDVIDALDELTCQALALDDPLGTNVTGLLTGKAMNAKFMACSYLQHPTDFVGSDDKAINSCPILLEIERIIDGTEPSPVFPNDCETGL